MAAGQGFKTFTTGEVLTAGDVNGYLMQGINVFTNATARDAAITAPAEGQFAFTKDNNSLWYYDGAAWVASGATGDIEGVTVTSPLTGGGTSGTVTVGILSGTTSNLGAVQLSDSTGSTSTTLAATANAVKSAYDLAAAAIPKSTVTTNGDLIYGTGSGTVARLGIGSTGQVLNVSGGVPAWTTPTASAENFASLGSASLSGATTITVSGFSAKNNLLIIVDQGSSANASSTFTLRFNSDTGNNYNEIRYIFSDGGGISRDYAWPATSHRISTNDTNANSNTRAVISVTGAAGTGYKSVNYMSYPSGGTGLQSNWAQGWYTGSSAITSVSLISSTGNFDAGTLYVYGG
jgi:hypothetical protein